MNTASVGYSVDVADCARPLRGFVIAAHRPVQLALLLSALLHALALGWLPGLERLSSEAPLPLRILLPPVPPPLMPPAPGAAPPALPLPRAAAPVAAMRTPPAPPVIAAAPRADDAPPARPAVVAERPAPVAAVDSPPPAVAAPPAAIDAQALAGYGRSVAGAVAQHQRYPKLAQMRQWQGTTILQLEFAADGRLLETRVLSSSGHDVLDRQALDMVRAAQPLPPLPSALAGRALTVNVPVVFRLAG